MSEPISEATRANLVSAYRSALMDESLWARHHDSIAYLQAVARVSQWMFVFDQLGLPREQWPPVAVDPTTPKDAANE